jgi:hypothetical protein
MLLLTTPRIPMTTSRTPALVSVATVTTLLLVLGGCLRASSQVAPGDVATVGARPRTIPFENNAKDYVHVYLASDRREWFLGRVERGARVALRIPDECLAPDAGLMRLVVIVGAPTTPQVARDSRAIAFSQPASDLVRQQWTISQGLLTSEWLRGTGVRIAP